jgi:ABC-type dipeptide/oligopeptide/nickel transport system permease component
MRAYALRRFLLAIPTLLVDTTVLFNTFHIIPGGVMDLIVQQRSESLEGITAEEDREQLVRMLGLGYDWDQISRLKDEPVII